MLEQEKVGLGKRRRSRSLSISSSLNIKRDRNNYFGLNEPGSSSVNKNALESSYSSLSSSPRSRLSPIIFSGESEKRGQTSLPSNYVDPAIYQGVDILSKDMRALSTNDSNSISQKSFRPKTNSIPQRSSGENANSLSQKSSSEGEKNSLSQRSSSETTYSSTA